MKYIFEGGGNYYITIPPPYLPREGGNGYIAIFQGGIYYIAIFPPIQVHVRGKNGYIGIFPGGKMAMGKNGSITPAVPFSFKYLKCNYSGQ